MCVRDVSVCVLDLWNYNLRPRPKQNTPACRSVMEGTRNTDLQEHWGKGVS